MRRELVARESKGVTGLRSPPALPLLSEPASPMMPGN